MVTLEINGTTLELDPSQLNLGITYALNDIRDISTRNTTHSNTFQVPAFPLNRRSLNFPEEAAATGGPIQGELLPAILRVDDQIILEGVCELTAWDRDRNTYEMTLYSNLDFLNQARELKLETLAWAELDHTYTYTDIQASWDNDHPKPYVYPLLDFGDYLHSYNANTNLRVRDWLPCVRLHHLLERGLSALNYRLEGSFAQSPVLKQLIIPYTWGRFRRPQIWADARSGGAIRVGGPQNLPPGVNTGLSFNFTQYGNSAGVFDTGTGTFTADSHGWVTFGVSAQFTDSGFFRVIQNGALTVTVAAGLDFSYDNAFLMAPGDTVRFEFNNPNSFVVSFGGTVSFTADPTYVEEADIFGESLAPPGMYLMDLIKALVQMFALFVRIDGNKRILYLDTFEEFYDPALPVLDWSDKLNLNAPIRHEYGVSGLARRNLFKWAPDSADPIATDYTKQYPGALPFGDGMLPGHPNAQETERTIAQLPFACTPMVYTYSHALHLPKLHFAKLNPLSNQLEYTDMDAPHILYYGGLQMVPEIGGNILPDYKFNGFILTHLPYSYSYKIKYSSLSLNSLETNLIFEKPISLSEEIHGFTLTEGYYSHYFSWLTKTRLISCEVEISSAEISNLKFEKVIYITNIGSKLLLNKVVDYAPLKNGSTQIELLIV